MTRPAPLFDPDPEFDAIVAAPAPAPTSGRRFAWRKPDAPREQACLACGGAAPCGMDGGWWCLNCVPDTYWPKAG